LIILQKCGDSKARWENTVAVSRIEKRFMAVICIDMFCGSHIQNLSSSHVKN